MADLVTAATERDLRERCEQFVYTEAELIDAGRHDQWLDCFDSPSWYWLPLDTTRSEPRKGLNLIFDDRNRLEDRVSRLHSGLSHTEEPQSRTSHLLGSIRLLTAAEAAPVLGWVDPATVRCWLTGRMIVARTRMDRTEVFHGRVSWALSERADGSLGIRAKRVDLIDADAPQPALTFLI